MLSAVGTTHKSSVSVGGHRFRIYVLGIPRVVSNSSLGGICVTGLANQDNFFPCSDMGH